MIVMEIMTKVSKYYEEEYINAKRAIERNNMLDTTSLNITIVNSTLSRCLGVALFVQSLDVPYERINSHYEKLRQKMNALLEDGGLA